MSKRMSLQTKHPISVVFCITFADAIIVFKADTPKKLIDKLIPNVLVKGSEYKAGEVFGEKVISNGGKIILVDLLPGISTSILIKKNNLK